MAKAKVVFECSECGDKHNKWQGKCNGCGAWNSLIEVVEEAEAKMFQLIVLPRLILNRKWLI